MNVKTKAKTLLLSYMLILGLMANDNKSFHNLNYSINKDYSCKGTTYYGSFSKGKVYIISSRKELKMIKPNKNDVIVVDERYDDDPNFHVYNSQRINDVESIKEILLILKEYEKEYTSNWNRSINSMKDEWLIHNLCYHLNIKLSKTKSVDLNNKDSFIYGDFIKRK